MNTTELQELLDRWDWEVEFDDRTLSRASGYYDSHRVILLQHVVRDGEDVLSAKVKGSRSEPYACTVRIRCDDDMPKLAADCSCPVGSFCKHAAAGMMMATSTPHEFWPEGQTPPAIRAGTPVVVPSGFERTHCVEPLTDLTEWQGWLRGLRGGPENAPFRIAETGRKFGLLLRVDPQRPLPTLRVSPVWLRPSRSTTGIHVGQLVDPQALRLDRHGPVPMPADGWPPGVPAALTILMHGYAERAGQRWWEITADYQETALLALLAHYPVYLERSTAPLEFGEPLPLQMRWKDQPDGSQRLEVTAAAGELVQLLGGVRLWYLLPESRRFGLVHADPALAQALHTVPVVRPEQVSALRQLLLANTGTMLPLPAARSAPEVVTVVPVPVLELHLLDLGYGHRHVESLPGFARLSYDYAGNRLTVRDTGFVVRRLQEGRVLDIRRHAATEQRVASQLAQLGFERADWHSVSFGRPRSQIQLGDLLLKSRNRHVSLPAGEWQPVIDQLVAAGFRIEFADGFPHDELVEIDGWQAELTPAENSWFDVSLGVDIAGERIDLLPVLRQLIVDPTFPLVRQKGEKRDAKRRIKLDATRSIELPLARLRALIEPLLEWLEGDLDASPRVHRSQALELDASGLAWRGGEMLRAQLEALRTRCSESKPPHGFKATLRPYQRDGLAWLDFLAEAGLGGILADDMGLGKTVQVLAHVLGEKERGRLDDPVLVIAPTSLVGNWQAEAERFAPALRVLVLHGADRSGRYDVIGGHDLVITTYPLLPRDQEKLVAARFTLLVLDEAQAIKNANSQAAHVVRKIPAKRRLAMTGTPLENHLGELWAQFDAVEPGLLGSQRQFARLYRTPIEKHGDGERQQRLIRRVGPLLLRRRKDEVLADLPPKTEIVRTLELESDQRALYETLRLAQHKRVRQAVAERGLAQSGIIVLDALLKLRQACCDPRLVKLASAKKVKVSAKLEALLELLAGLLEDGRRVLLFSQFTEMLALIEEALAGRGIVYQTLTGQTPARERTDLVKRFQQGQSPLFLISLKAGGVGLNLTAADTVIHYDPWWNPAVEAQATDRAHRIGQDKPVFVYRLICKGTVEEKIQAMQVRKSDLARAVLEGGGKSTRLRFDAEDLDALFSAM